MNSCEETRSLSSWSGQNRNSFNGWSFLVFDGLVDAGWSFDGLVDAGWSFDGLVDTGCLFDGFVDTNVKRAE